MNEYQLAGVILLIVCVAIAIWGLWPRWSSITISEGGMWVGSIVEMPTGERLRVVASDATTITVDSNFPVGQEFLIDAERVTLRTK
jgi:hypothetical protein